MPKTFLTSTTIAAAVILGCGSPPPSLLGTTSLAPYATVTEDCLVSPPPLLDTAVLKIAIDVAARDTVLGGLNALVSFWSEDKLVDTLTIVSRSPVSRRLRAQPLLIRVTNAPYAPIEQRLVLRARCETEMRAVFGLDSLR